jgi:hypothetical protein
MLIWYFPKDKKYCSFYSGKWKVEHVEYHKLKTGDIVSLLGPNEEIHIGYTCTMSSKKKLDSQGNICRLYLKTFTSNHIPLISQTT